MKTPDAIGGTDAQQQEYAAKVRTEAFVCERVCEYAMDVGMPEYSGITNGTCGNCDHYAPGPDGEEDMP